MHRYLLNSLTGVNQYTGDIFQNAHFKFLKRSVRDVTSQRDGGDVEGGGVGVRDGDLVPNSSNNINSNYGNSRPVDTAGHTGSDPRALPFASIPNFFQAILTLVICGLLLAACLLIIRKARSWCSGLKRTWSDDEGLADGADADVDDVENQNTEPLKSSAQTQNSTDPSSIITDISEHPVVGVSNGTAQQSVSPSPVESKKDVVSKKGSPLTTTKCEESRPHSSCSTSSQKKKSPRVAFVRRTSGPFGDEALAYVEQTYQKVTKKTKDLIDSKHHPYEAKQSSWRRASSKRVIKKGQNKSNEHNRRSLPIPTIIVHADSQEMLDGDQESHPMIPKLKPGDPPIASIDSESDKETR